MNLLISKWFYSVLYRNVAQIPLWQNKRIFDGKNQHCSCSATLGSSKWCRHPGLFEALQMIFGDWHFWSKCYMTCDVRHHNLSEMIMNTNICLFMFIELCKWMLLLWSCVKLILFVYCALAHNHRRSHSLLLCPFSWAWFQSLNCLLMQITPYSLQCECLYCVHCLQGHFWTLSKRNTNTN